MIWVDREVKKIKERGKKLEWVDDMKTPSGRIHVGALRGVVIHDLVYKVLLENKVKSKFTYVFDDHDPMDAIPSYLDYDKWEKYAGMQLYKIPSPEKGYRSFAEYYAKEFIQVFESINCYPEIIWASKLYNSGKMNTVIKEILDASDKVREIYLRVSKVKKKNDWHPFNVVCEKCGKVGTTYVYKWDGKEVYYRCEHKMVAWAMGCGHEGKISPYNGNGKLNWRVDWPAKWKVIGVTVEGAGKDHMSSGGSYDMAVAVCREILNYHPTYPLTYEWFTIGGRKMSSSKGVGTSAKDMRNILPPEVLRFLIVRTPIQTALDFNPFGETILNLFDDYDRCLNAYFDKLEGKVPEGKSGEVLSDFARIAKLSEVRALPKERIFLPRFRTAVNLIKTRTDILKFFEKQKGKKLITEEKELLKERTTYAQQYLRSYATEEEKVEFLKEVSEDLRLSVDQVKFLTSLAKNIKKLRIKNRDKLQQAIYGTLKAGNYSAKEVFPAFYQVTIGKEFGPKAADLILLLGIDKVVKRLQELK